MKEKLQHIAGLFTGADPFQPSVFVGFDGYIDKIQHLVKKSADDQHHFFPDIRDFSRHVAGLAGISGQIELVTQLMKAGGNAPIMAGALANLGCRTTCMGTMGQPQTHAVFRELEERCTLISIGQAAESNAFEFEDGKIIFSELSVFHDLDWEFFRKAPHFFQQLEEQISKCRLSAFVDWANLPHATAIWQGIVKDILPRLPANDRLFFFDLCDPFKRSPAEIREVLEVISSYSPYGRTILGLNKNETLGIYQHLFDDHRANPGDADLQQIAIRIFEAIDIDCLLVHPTDWSFVVTPQGLTAMRGRLVAEPMVLTGAGDNFNAGFAYALLQGFDLEYCLLVAMATSGAYIRNGESPDVQKLIEYFQIWEKEL